ncbi:MAG: hypothetical protein IT385_29080 [Deltaproteobacteria bacterium]|nr:hypothetical protein [Deltaproteobacteria bacterium]
MSATNPFQDAQRPRGEASWDLANDGLDLLRVAIIGSIVSSIFFKLLARGVGATAAVLEIIAALIFGIVVVTALGKWRAVPPETRARGLADMAWIGSIINLVGTAVSIVITLMAIGGSFRSMRKLEPWIILVAIIGLVGSVLQIVGFLLSARATALHLDRPDIAGRATTTLVLGTISVVIGLLATLGVLGKKSGAMVGLFLLLALAIATLIVFLMTLSGLQQAIRDRPDVSEAFT